MSPFIPVTDAFLVAPQLRAADFAAAAAAGIVLVINNRPDGEAPDQLPGASAETAAHAAGLKYAAVPISGAPSPDAIEATQRLLAQAEGPVLAYCRSGTRSITVWALASAASGTLAPEAILAAARAAGYELSALGPALRRAHGGLG